MANDDNTSKIPVKAQDTDVEGVGMVQMSLSTRSTEQEAIEAMTGKALPQQDHDAQLAIELQRVNRMLHENWLSVSKWGKRKYGNLPALRGATAQSWLAGYVGMRIAEVRRLLK